MTDLATPACATVLIPVETTMPISVARPTVGRIVMADDSATVTSTVIQTVRAPTLSDRLDTVETTIYLSAR